MPSLLYVCILGLTLSPSVFAEIVELRQMQPFSYIDAKGIRELEIINGQEQRVEVIGETSQVRAVNTSVDDGELVITARTTRGRERAVRLLVRVKQLQGVDVSGSVKVRVTAIRGILDFDVSGATIAQLEGQVRRLNISISGASEVWAENLVADSVEADLSGAALLNVHVKQRLAVEASGGSRVVYQGQPKKLVTELTGLATLTSLAAQAAVNPSLEATKTVNPTAGPRIGASELKVPGKVVR